ncbi:Arylesterase [Trichoplax sp. H2]|uniref:AB hydrolase-1 domain-containing protein n=1 Tax=Trichoplax adhaerens TaxID=10228 RepID=B3RUP5_TRIAD|nr:hypothetical protein TRIADDRAFT_55364 [Trichoplax adhaerens]EDV25360.1 hypothetical protein TRIADDRAFT_55364 [Trichoplax adhaerens]RDD42943.1 Arylesterase [Trichoplax sp. H2]|eukprot:XP_002111393.1 hypothetical protein TRIADDRAFT_55364 [Trichoplax adhaerens]
MAKTFNYKNSTLAYQDQGNGFPIIFIGSYLCDRSMWRDQVEHLSKRYRCIVLELWDHGQSGHLPSASTTLDELTDDVWEFVRHLQLERFAYIGLSIGGMIGARLALKHPQAIAVLGLFNTGLDKETPENLAVFPALLQQVDEAQAIFPVAVEKLSMAFFSQNSFIENAQYVSEWIEGLINSDTRKIPGTVAIGRAVFQRASILDQISQIQVPTLSLTGDQEFIFPPAIAEEIASRIKGAACVIVPGASHISPIDNPQVVIQAIEELLSKI